MVNRTAPVSPFLQAIREHLRSLGQLESQLELFEQIADRMIRAIRGGNKILWCGNGGSAADSQHLAAEIVGRFRRERRGWASIALTTDTSILTALGNDYGYQAIFARQIETLCQAGDVVVGLTTSGNSQNVCNAIQCARTLGAFTVGMTGEGGGKLASHGPRLPACGLKRHGTHSGGPYPFRSRAVRPGRVRTLHRSPLKLLSRSWWHGVRLL